MATLLVFPSSQEKFSHLGIETQTTSFGFGYLSTIKWYFMVILDLHWTLFILSQYPKKKEPLKSNLTLPKWTYLSWTSCHG